MPELPEVEAVCQVVRRALTGRTIVSAHVARRRFCLPQTPAAFARAVAGRRYREVERRGKNILIHLEGVTLWAHLRMTGNLYPLADPRLRVSTVAAWLVLDNGGALAFNDPRGLGMLRAVDPQRLPPALHALGPDPLSPAFTAEHFVALAHGVKSPVKIWLLDQRRLAGHGNIYAAEALYRAGIDPRRPAGQLRRARLVRLHAAIVGVLTDALQSAAEAYRRPGRFAEGEWFDVAVYGREGLPCRRCGRRVRRIPQGGRSTYFCPRCQR